MAFRPDLDLIIFLYTTGVIIFGGMKRLRRNRRQIPLEYQFKEVPSTALTPAQTQYLAAYDEKLAAMNYWPTCTFSSPKIAHNLIRSYYSPAETSRFVVMVIETTIKLKGGGDAVGQRCVIEFISRFRDGRVLATRNAKSSIMDQPPHVVRQQIPSIKEPAELKRRHDSRGATMGLPLPPASDAASVFKEVEAAHRRFSEHQLARGIYTLDVQHGCYVLSDKANWRGIRDFLNPLANNFSKSQLLAAVMAGAGVPAIGVLKFAPAAAIAAQNIGFPPVIASDAVVLTCYLVAGTFIGYVLERQIFIWAFLITYVTVHLAVGWAIGPLPFSAFAGVIAWSVAQAKKRRRSILLPHSA